MLFNSYIFIFLFFPIVLIGYYTLNFYKKYKSANLFLIGMSLWFYGFFNQSYLIIICGSIGTNFIVAKTMEKIVQEQKPRRIVLFLGICANIAVIFYFKYFDFFIQNINIVFGRSFGLRHIVLPLGISFFTFQQISYLVDSYRGETSGYTFDEYALFVLFFPQLIAGPIVLHSEMIPQFKNHENRRFIPYNFAKGMYIFSIGLCKKVIIADTFGKAVTWGFATIETLSSLEALIVSLSYTFQLYFDFSGYCDMALGIGYMLNIKLIPNFNSPYKSTSMIEFWNRWHMSLTRFLRTYVYIPLGGNRKGKIRTYINVLVVYLVSGIWHGANWTFVLWGAFHGLFSCLNRLFIGSWKKLNVIIQWFITFMTVNMLWILFRAECVSSAALFMKRMYCYANFSIRPELYECFNLIELTYIEEKLSLLVNLPLWIEDAHLWLFLLAAFIIVLNLRNSKEIQFRPTVLRSLTTVLFLVWSVMSFAGISTFLYFNF